MLRILTIDGGGIRGIIPATVLAELERRTGAATCDLFDLIVGSSTGGLLALGLTAPRDGRPRYTAEELAALYQADGPTIFSRPLVHRILAAGNLLGPKYPPGPIEQVLHRHFSGVRLREALATVVVPAYEIEMRLPFFFRSARAVQDPAYDWSMAQAARATTAAPTYFPPVRLRADVTDPRASYALIDGGVFANNPAMVGYAEARTTDPDEHDLLLLSLGTGSATRPIRYDQARRWGVAQWARPILDVVFDGVSGTVDYEVARLMDDALEGTRHYWRLQPVLRGAHEAIDDASPDNMRALRALAQRFVDEHEREIDAVAEALQS